VSGKKPPVSLEWNLLPFEPIRINPDGSLNEEGITETIGSKVRYSSDELVFEDDVPVVIQARYRLALTLARLYGGDATLYDLGASQGTTFMAFIHGPELGEVIPCIVSDSDVFLRSLRTIHSLLEMVYCKGYTFQDVLSSNEAAVSVPVKGNVAPN
jgi:hypothetical protein